MTVSRELLGKYVLVAFYKPVSKRWGVQVFNGNSGELNALHMANHIPDWNISSESFATANEAFDAVSVGLI